MIVIIDLKPSKIMMELKKAGSEEEIHTFGNTKDAVDFIYNRPGKPRIIILDPIIEKGRELCFTLKAKQITNWIPLILVTDPVNLPHLHNCILLSNLVIPKPVTADILKPLSIIMK